MCSSDLETMRNLVLGFHASDDFRRFPRRLLQASLPPHLRKHAAISYFARESSQDGPAVPLRQSQRPQSWPELDRFLLRGGLLGISVDLRAGMEMIGLKALHKALEDHRASSAQAPVDPAAAARAAAAQMSEASAGSSGAQAPAHPHA